MTVTCAHMAFCEWESCQDFLKHLKNQKNQKWQYAIRIPRSIPLARCTMKFLCFLLFFFPGQVPIPPPSFTEIHPAVMVSFCTRSNNPANKETGWKLTFHGEDKNWYRFRTLPGANAATLHLYLTPHLCSCHMITAFSPKQCPYTYILYIIPMNVQAVMHRLNPAESLTMFSCLVSHACSHGIGLGEKANA